MRSLLRGALAAAALLLAVAAPARAARPAVLAGVVQDEAGRPLPNARVTIAEIGRTAVTGDDGTFVFRQLRAGTYHLDATLLGYAPGHAEVVLPAQGDARVVLTLRTTALSIEGINVTASPGSADPMRITQSTTELSGKALERAVGTTVAATLASQPGMAERYNGPAASTPVIRGLSGERVLVLENGQRTGDLSASSADHALSVDPLAASRLEVVRGPASLLYGSNALGGVVNVISSEIPTTVPRHVEGWLSGQGESVTRGGAATGEITAPLGGDWAVTLRGGGRRTDDVRSGGGGRLANTDLRSVYGLAGIGYVGERVQGGISAGGYDFEYGLPAPPDAEEAGVRLRGHRWDATGRADVVLGDRGLVALRVDGTAQAYTHDEVEPNGDIGTTFQLNTQTAAVTARTAFGRLTGAVGLSGLLRDYAPEGEEALTPAATTRTGGVFVYQELALGEGDAAPRLQAGARWDAYRIAAEDDDRFGEGRTRDVSNLSGSLGVSVPLTPAVTLSGSVGRSFRAPTVEELFSDAYHAAVGAYEVGDAALDVETNTGVEAVVRAQSGRVNAQVAGFWNRISDYIAPVLADSVDVEDEEGGGTFRAPRFFYRQGDAELRGVEAQAELTVTPRLVLGVLGDVTIGDYTGGALDGEPLPFMPPARLGGTARWDDGRWSVGADYVHAFAQDRPSVGETETDAYDRVDAHVGLSLIRGGRVHSVTLRVDNLLDERYRDATSRIKDFAPNPGRNVSLVYRLLF